jgi:DNA invertase Pin-like site-specific DNA recombinase
MRVAIYARVSTTDQTCEMQLRELREYAARHGWTPTEYVDTGFSGSRASRPALDRLMADARAKKVDVVIVWKLDRWGRSVSNCLASIADLTRLGVRWIAVTQNLDTDQNNPMARFMLTIMAAVAEFEREMIRERVKAGMANAKSRGNRLGRKRVVFDRDKALLLQARGFSQRSIARQLGVGLGTVSRALSGDKPRSKKGA